ncbi:hypothetical protein M422DRAFT_39641 [Sphaerobolus stellatus SS14]|uniref:Uncharacterized protein n=1 Tax=Sphaerobolus stellatus (strain SS14) TaxID=990650 RepID=A0A0C9UE10_SPHS4|nr:hypothetical protein M422DRAFT_39641 [Sphaerobolus stellatus SS14]
MPSRKVPRFGFSHEEQTRRQAYQIQRDIVTDIVERDYDDQTRIGHETVSNIVEQPRHEFYTNREFVDAMLPPPTLNWRENLFRGDAERKRLQRYNEAMEEINDVGKQYLTSSEKVKVKKREEANQHNAPVENPRELASTPSPEFTQLSPRPGRVPRVIPPAANHQRSPSQMTTSTMYTEERSNSNTSTRRSYDTGRHSSNYDSEAGHSSINNPRHSVYSTVGGGITQSHTNVETRRSSGRGSTSTSHNAPYPSSASYTTTMDDFQRLSLDSNTSIRSQDSQQRVVDLTVNRSAGSGGARRSTSSSDAQSRTPQKRKEKGKGKEPESTFNITSTKRYPDDDNDRSSGSRGGGHGRTIAYNTSSQGRYRE